MNYGYIDKTGKVVIPFIYWDAGFFEDGIAPVRSYQKGWGYIDMRFFTNAKNSWTIA